jgi:hypothetical protein
MLARIALLLIAAQCMAAGIVSPPAAAATGIRVVYSGKCVVAGGVRDQSGAPVKRWDMWQEIFLTSSPTWLHAHTHHGAECITNVYGVTSWWFAHGDASPSAPPTIVPASAGRTVYTVQGRVHTAGNTGPRMQAYLGIHLLEQGSDFNYPVDDPSAPPVVTSIPLSVFKNEMPNQVPSPGTVTIANQMLEFGPGASYSIAASGALGYYTVIGGGAVMRISNGPRTTIVAMAPGKTITLPRNASATIRAKLPTMLAATELVPQPG